MDYTYLADLVLNKYLPVTLGSVKKYATNVVDINNVDAAYQAVPYLIEAGHTEIACFAGPPYSTHSHDRYLGFQQALMDNNLPILKDFIIQIGSYIEKSYFIGKKFFIDSNHLPTAVFCYNDLITF